MHDTGKAWVTGMHSPTPVAEHVELADHPVADSEQRTDSTGDDVADHLRALIARGFRFAYPRRANGEIAAVVGVRAHHGVVDIVQLLGEREADAVRIPGDEPDILSPRRVLWRGTGPARTVLTQVLHLPDSDSIDSTDCGSDSARTEHNGCWVPAGHSHSVWLPSTAR